MDQVIDTTDAVTRLSRDLRKASSNLSVNEARYLVDAYYQMQKNRIVSGNQVKAMSDEPHEILGWFATQSDTLEGQIKGALDVWTKQHPVGQWARGHKGVGPVIAAGILSRIDMDGISTVGQIWRFAGLDPTSKWEKGKKRPWNADLKRLCWILGESFTKVSGRDDAYYGQVYRQRKDREIAKNDAGDFADQAKAALENKKFGKDTEARKHYEAGKLPPARINLRAQRYAVKLFLAHLFEVWYWEIHGEIPPLPYVIAHMGHAHRLDVPNAPVDMAKALRGKAV